MELPAAETWQRIDTVLAEALDRPPDQRKAFLDTACADEPELRHEVRALLDAERTAPGFLDEAAVDLALPLLPDLPPGLTDASAETPVEGRRVGSYRLLRELGRGGMSTVFLAERADGAAFEQRVALKLLPPALSSDALVRRFEQEQQIMASLAHPHIAKLLDGGVTDDGQPYFALEYVNGRPVDAYCRDEHCSVEERLALFAEVARAVQHAHRNLVVHRDLKPSNILITGEGAPKLLDFGIAKLLAEHDLPATSLRTHTGARWLTLPYAAPEQVRGEPVTTETDVYQLGAVLYELLTGRRPFHDEEEQPNRRSRRALEDAVLERPPQPPSAVAGKATKKALHGDLDRIILKALRKEPEQRYRSVEALVEDIERYQSGQPVQARAGTWTYRAKKFAGRHRWGVATAATLMVLVAAFVAAMAWQVQQTAHQRDRAQAEAGKAEQVSAFMVNLFEASNPAENQGDTLTARRLLARGEERVETLDDQPLVQAQMLDAMGRAHRGLAHYDTSRALLRRALKLRRNAHGPDHPDVAESLDHLAGAYAAERDFEPTVPLYREALAIRRQSLGKKHLKTAGTLDGLARALRNMDKPDSAVTLARRALGIRRRQQDSTHPDVTDAEHTLAYALRAAGQYDEAATRYRRVLRKKRAHYGPKHSRLAATHNDFAFLLKKQERYAVAARHYRKAIAISQSVYGPVHSRTMMYRSNLVGALVKNGKHAEAEAVMHQKLSALRKHAPNDSAQFRRVRDGLARVHLEQGRFASAVEPIRTQYRSFQDRFGEKHLWTIRKAGELGAVLKALGRDDEADALLRQNHAYLQAKRDTILQRRDSYTRLDTEHSLRLMVKIFEQAGLPDLARRSRALRKQYTLRPES